MEQMQQILQELEAMKARLDAAEARAAKAETEAQAADDYRQIVNAMMGHVYSYYNHSERNDLEDYWVRSRDDIVYAHNNLGYVGRQGVWEYYIDGTDRNKARYAAIDKRIYNLDPPEGAAAGYRVIHVLGSPYVEIAKDRKTAQGIWMSFSFMSNMDQNGEGNPSYVLQRFAGDFLREDDKWRLWHIRDYTDVSMEIETNLLGPDDVERDADGRPVEHDGPPMGNTKKKEGPGGGEQKDSGMPPPPARDGVKNRTLTLESSNMYNPWTWTVNEPKIPQAYEVWDPAQSYITVAPEHQDEGCAWIVE